MCMLEKKGADMFDLKKKKKRTFNQCYVIFEMDASELMRFVSEGRSTGDRLNQAQPPTREGFIFVLIMHLEAMNMKLL